MALANLALMAMALVVLRAAHYPAQSPAGAEAGPAFEVASVKPTDAQSRDPIGMFTYPGGRMNVTKFTLRMLIETAYGVKTYQVSGELRDIHPTSRIGEHSD